MLSILLAGLLSAVAPQSATPTAPITPPAPGDVDNDAACLLVLTQLHGAYDAMPAGDKKTELASVDELTKTNMSFFLGAVTARRSDTDLQPVLDKASRWLWAKSKDDSAAFAATCYAVVKPRMQMVPNALRAIAKSN